MTGRATLRIVEPDAAEHASALPRDQPLPQPKFVGGTAAALHAGHRQSLDADHVVGDLRDRFDEVLAELESVAGWQTARIQRPAPILGALDGFLTGIRLLRRTRPLETEVISGLANLDAAERALT